MADQLPILARSDLIEHIVQVVYDVEVAEQDRCSWGAPGSRIAERGPHVHEREPHTLCLRLPEKPVELAHARFASISTTEPGGSPAQQVADHDPVVMSIANGDLIDADSLRSAAAGSPQLLAHVALFQFSDRMPVKQQFAGGFLEPAGPASRADIEHKAVGVKRVVLEEVQAFALFRSALAIGCLTSLKFQVDPHRANGKVANATRSAILLAMMRRPKFSADRFFPGQTRRTMRACASPNSPMMHCRG